MNNKYDIQYLYNEQYSLEKRLEALKLDILIAKDNEDIEEWEFLKNERKELRNKLQHINIEIEKQEQEVKKQNQNIAQD